MNREFLRFVNGAGGWSARLAFGLLVLAALSGCSGPAEIELSGTTDDAQKTLSSALDAWKSGKKADTLLSASPPIRIADEDWEAGKSLKSFELPATAVKHGGHWRVAAVLTVVGDGAAEEQKNVAYAVTMKPSISVIRADDVVE